MTAALVLVDVQHDLLARAGLTPEPGVLVARIEELLAACRARRVPVFHVHTVVRADGADAMPHWRRQGTLACVVDTPGARPPDALAPARDEVVIAKRFYSPFADGGLEAEFRARGVDTLIVAGIYLHACVRQAVLDAYERGLEVWVAADAVGSTDPVHAAITREYLAGRAATFLGNPAIAARLDGGSAGAAASAPVSAASVGPASAATSTLLPVAFVAGRWTRPGGADPRYTHRAPARSTEIVAEVPLARGAEVARACAAAAAARREADATPVARRVARLRALARSLAAREEAFVDLLVHEIGKPRRQARAEIARAVGHVESAVRLVEAEPAEIELDGVRVRHRPLGVIGIVTPWNNPIAIPLGKIAPALALGNTVVWKPAPEGSRAAVALVEALEESGLAGGVSVVLGDAETARLVIADPAVAAVSLTGSVATGRLAAALCARAGKPLQAELGGNNAALVLADADLRALAPALAAAAFAFAGQRCTAIRRFVVVRAVYEQLVERLAAAAAALPLGDPADAAVEVGPIVSTARRTEVEAAIARAVGAGARVVCGGGVPPGFAHGAWLAPALLAGVAPESRAAQEEVFGPVATILPAADLEEALAIANGVPHGLVAALVSDDPAAQARFLAAIEAGIVQLAPGPVDVHPDAPFGGWKASGLGPPEHGVWDRQFYARPQAVYGGRR